MNWSRFVYIAVAALMLALYVSRVYAGDGNGEPIGMIRAVLGN